MTFQAAMVFLLGIIFLVWGLKTKTPPDNEVLKLQKLYLDSLGEVREELSILETRIRNLESAFKSIGPLVPKKSQAPIHYSKSFKEIVKLAEEGWSVTEIANKLELGQDAINMVLNTYRRERN